MSDSDRERDATYFWPTEETSHPFWIPEPDLREPWATPRHDDAYRGPSRSWSPERQERVRRDK